MTKQENINKGNIIINKKNLNNYTNSEIRKIISFITKDVFLIEGSVKDNLDILGKLENAEIEEFLYRFEDLFKFKEFEIFNKDNFNRKIIKKNGTNLSEGQKNFINILRALIKKNKIICLDESNSELDNETEKTIFNIIFEKFKEITFVVITHKLEILDKFDYVYVIEDGEIVNKGIPMEIKPYLKKIKFE